MGLLDDAIREHLELKRLRGADPGDVAREEQDALGSVRREGESKHNDQEVGEPAAPADGGGSFSPPSDLAPAASSSTVGQETVEIDIDAELDAARDPGDLGAADHGRAAPVAHPAHTQTSAEESLQWEVPGDPPDEGASSASSESDADPPPDDHSEAATHVEDVLEETPDFLRDKPEQERLWFEQRPPRDFDFNE
jgi:hypothetical protein